MVCFILFQVHNISPELLAKREVIVIDIANDPIESKEYTIETDPKLFSSKNDPDRGPLTANWIQDAKEKKKPFMCCYKLITIKFKVFGLESKMENFIAKVKICPNCFKISMNMVYFNALAETYIVPMIDGSIFQCQILEILKIKLSMNSMRYLLNNFYF